MDVAAELADHVAALRFESFSAELVPKIRAFTLSTLAGALAGTAVAGSQPIVEVFAELSGKRESTVLGLPVRVAAPEAALLNAMYAQAADFDDIHDRALVRPFSIAVPAALAMAERIGGVSGRDFITAISAAVDVTVRLGLAAPLTTLRWARPSTLGTFGAAVAAAKLLGLDGARTLDALGIAYSQAAGTTQAMKDGAVIKRVQPGFAARAGVTSAILAEHGVTGPANALEGQNGYFNMYEGGRYERSRITERLGTYNYAAEVAFKPYPCAAEVHGVLDATLALVREHTIVADDVRAIRIQVPPLVQDLGGRPYPPANGSVVGAALASVRYGAATAIVNGEVGLRNYSQAAVVDPRTLALVELTEVESAPVTGAQYFTPATVEITTTARQTFRKTVTTVHGHADDPLEWPEIVDKFRACATSAMPPIDSARQDSVIERVDALEELPDVGDIARLLAPTA